MQKTRSAVLSPIIKFLGAICFLWTFALLGPTSAVAGKILVKVDISQQRMTVYKNGIPRYHWKVSTARRGKVTPRGRWRAKWLSRNHRSSRYNGAAMPHSIFYSGNFAIHGTYNIKRLGRPASAGCIRLHPKNAAVLYNLARSNGLRNTTVSVRN